MSSRKLPLVPDGAVLTVQPELVASFSRTESTLSKPPLVHFLNGIDLPVYASVVSPPIMLRGHHVLRVSAFLLSHTGPAEPHTLSVVC